ncbi:MAG: hypothetical protein HY323_07270 [Betaproteobacteria bacterium]|nr:hypothetical protein [Betaproteobacteria bacterium]
MSISYPLSMPSSPTAFRGMRLIGDSRVALEDSPFTGEQQVQDWGGKLWRFSAALPPMKRAEAEEWAAFLLKLNGPRYTFLAGDPLGATPRGSAGGTPTVRYRQNRFYYSEQFDNAIWAKDNATITANAVANPINAEVTADALVASALNVTPGCFQEFDTQSGIHTVSIHIKAGTKTWFRFLCLRKDGTERNVWFNLNTGVIGTVEAGITGGINSLGSGWYRCSAEFDVLAGATISSARVYAVDGDAVGACTIAAGAVALYLFGAQDDVADTVGPSTYVTTGAAIQVNVVPAVGAQVLYTDGWPASADGVLKAGDYIQHGTGSTSRLYKMLLDANSDVWGNLTLNIWPGLRESPAAGASIVTSSCKGVFRLAQRLSPWDMDHQGIYGIAFDAVEAI